MSIKNKISSEDYQIFRTPLVTEEKDLFYISPLAVIDHVKRDPNRELEKTIKDDSIEFKVLSGVEYCEEDPTQKNWRFEYGVEFFVYGSKAGLSRQFVDYEPVNSTRESAQATISDNIFTKLENRTLRNYAKKGFDEAAEILRGEDK